MLYNGETNANAAQHSVHPIPGKVRRGWRGGTAARRDSVRVFGQFAWLGAGSGKTASPRPAWLSNLSRHTSG
jgi:hypothetical protein